ncbi:MAG: hypothetical protein QMD95_03220 [Candidatus Hodarchaeaceae archaeon]|nr:hypothetical protein [Candidatus Hodarchaeaceae archaeon]
MGGSRFKAKFWRCASKTKKLVLGFLGHGVVRGVLEFFLMLGILYFIMSGALVLAFRTDSYWMAVISNSMKHDGDTWREPFANQGYDTSQFPLQGGFERGDLLIIQGVYSVSEIAIGDVVIMDQGPGIIPLAHRVVYIWEENGRASFRTKGDANLTYEVFEPEDVLGKVVFVIPKLGHIALWFQGQ